jgi:hypothetical protein
MKKNRGPLSLYRRSRVVMWLCAELSSWHARVQWYLTTGASPFPLLDSMEDKLFSLFPAG